MLGILYLLLCFSVGYAICSYAFGNLSKQTVWSYDNSKIQLSPYLLLLPAWFVTGVLAVTWMVYITASIFANSSSPLTIANAIVLPIALLISMIAIYIRRQKNTHTKFLCTDDKVLGIESILLAGITLLACVLMWTTFYIRNGQLNIGISVYSDFSPHIGMIRSFSYGNNFPTAYSHFGGEDIRYHFMFQFFVGNLEYLGLGLDNAFNIPSILSLISAFMLLYVLTVKVTKRPGAGILSCLFFAFRSSKSLFTYLSKIPKEDNVLKTIIDNTDFIGDTPHEDWGLWNLNVYGNQRHLAFGLTVLFLVLILFLPHLYEMFETLKTLRIQERSGREYFNWRDIGKYIKVLLFSKESWKVQDAKLSIIVGILLGSLSFFHGAAVIGCLLILFFIAALAKRRLEFVVVAVLTVALSFLQSGYFIEGAVVSPEFMFGFIAENKSLFGVISYLERLLGILPMALLVAFCLERNINRYLLLAFLAPLIFAFTVSLTVDVTVNHKYIMMSVILLGIFPAMLAIKILDQKAMAYKCLGIILILLLTATGIYDFYSVIRKNTKIPPLILNMEDPLTEFVKEKSDSKDLFLTANYTINQLVLGGAMLYQGHQYYAWSAGYDTLTRDELLRSMYQAQTPEELDRLVKENNIRFIVVDYENRNSSEYKLNEDNIRSTYEYVYAEGEGDWKISIYDTTKPIYKPE